MSINRPSKKAEQSEITQHELVGVARTLFADRGYAAIGTEEIVRAAGVTRGALYHHYRNKLDLFEAVVEEVMRDIHSSLLTAAREGKDPATRLELGIAAFLRLSQRQDVLRIAFRDAPSVLGWQRWREIDSRYGLGLLKSVLSEPSTGLLPHQDAGVVAHLLLGALTEAALMIGHAEHPDALGSTLLDSLQLLLHGLLGRKDPTA